MAFQLTPDEQRLADSIDSQERSSLHVLGKERPLYYDRDGDPIWKLGVWAALYQRPGYMQLGSTPVNDMWVSTVWLGIDHSFGFRQPLIFETIIFTAQLDRLLLHPYGGSLSTGWMDRYYTEADAIRGHESAVYRAMRAGYAIRLDDYAA